MKKKLAFAVLLLVALGIMGLDIYRQMRVKQALTGLLPLNANNLVTFRATTTDARWVPIAPEDTSNVLRAYNANRLLLAEHVTPRLPFGGQSPIAIAPLAIIRLAGVEYEWHLAPRDDHLLSKYLRLSSGPDAPPAVP
jgi:hypothetical protein